MDLQLPAGFKTRSGRGAAWADWCADLPRRLAGVLEDWQLEVTGDVRTGETAVALPVETATGEAAVLKLGFDDPESEFEHLALRAWDGRGAVRLLRADPHRRALLLERLDADRDLHALPVETACAVLAGLYGQLHRSPPPQLDRLSDHCARWSAELAALRRGHLVPRRFVDQAIGLARDFSTDPDTDRSLIHTDLHYANVLAADREPWLVIDPKPLAGDPAYEVAPALWNRWPEAVATGDVRGAVLARLFALVDGAGLDEDRVRAWVVVREMVNVGWAVSEGVAAADPSWVTRAATIAKAVQR